MAAMRVTSVAKDLHQRSAKVKLDIVLHAPIIVVPQHSQSSNGLLFDLGCLKVNNSFLLKKQRLNDKTPVILDKLLVTLTNIKMSR